MHLTASETQPAATAARPPEFRLFLQEELGRRCRKNPRFSLRAFARTLDVEASALSKIMSGKRSLTSKMLHRMCTQLGIGQDELSRYEQALTQARPLPRTGERGARRLASAGHYALDPHALTVRANPARIADAHARLAALRDELRTFLEDGADDLSGVPYRLSLSLNPTVHAPAPIGASSVTDALTAPL